MSRLPISIPVSIPISIPATPSFTLLVQDRPIHCSRRVISSSSLFMDMVELVEDTSPIPIPAFISRQIMLDLVEMVEKGDWECADLILVSLSYLLDFLIAVDFLGCDKLKAVIEKKVKDKLSDSNWRDVLHYTENILGLDTTVKHTLEYICKRLKEMGGEMVSLSMKSDLYQEEYEQFTPGLMKIMLKNENLGSCVKFCILRNWICKNYDKTETEDTVGILTLIKYKDLEDAKLDEIVGIVRNWDMSAEQWEGFNTVIGTAKNERDLESVLKEQLEKAKKLHSREHFFDRFFGIPGDPELFFELI